MPWMLTPVLPSLIQATNTSRPVYSSCVVAEELAAPSTRPQHPKTSTLKPIRLVLACRPTLAGVAQAVKVSSQRSPRLMLLVSANGLEAFLPSISPMDLLANKMVSRIARACARPLCVRHPQDTSQVGPSLSHLAELLAPAQCVSSLHRRIFHQLVHLAFLPRRLCLSLICKIAHQPSMVAFARRLL